MLRNIPALLALLAATSQTLASPYFEIAIDSPRDHAFNGDHLLITSGPEVHTFSLTTCAKSSATLGESEGADLYGISRSLDGRFVAVADRTIVDGMARVFLFDSNGIGHWKLLQYPAGPAETGSFMPSWGKDEYIYISGSSNDSERVNLRNIHPLTGNVVLLSPVGKDSMLSVSADGALFGIVESNTKSGSVHSWGGRLNHKHLVSLNTGRFLFETSVSPDGAQQVVSSYSGSVVLKQEDGGFIELGTIGEYASWGPVSTVFTPDGKYLITAEWAWHTSPSIPGLHVYDASTLEWLGVLDAYPFPWVGNQSLREGRLSISEGGRWLAVNVAAGVRIYDLHAGDGPATRGCAFHQPASLEGGLRIRSAGSPLDFDSDGFPREAPTSGRIARPDNS